MPEAKLAREIIPKAT